MFRDLRLVAKATNVDAAPLERRLRARIDAIVRRIPKSPRPRVFCCEWLDPIFTTGHWVPELVRMAGGHDPLAADRKDSHPVPWSDVARCAPEKLILMPCGFTPERTLREISLLTRRRGWALLPAVKSGEVYVADGPNYFNGAGPRLVDALEILAEAIHPELICKTSPAKRGVRARSRGGPRAGYRRLTRAEISDTPSESKGEVRAALLRKGTIYDEDEHPRYG